MGDGTRGPGSGRRWVTFACVILLAAAFVAWAAPAGQASPTEATLSLTQLQALLDAAPGGKVDGYFKTVLKGATIETIPASVSSIIVNANAGSLPARLIMFEATGTAIARIGGVASGMSGSPLYVYDGTDKLVGAVSYGDIFTLGGLGLATPIEYMAAIETDYNVKIATYGLDAPVRTSSGTVKRVLVAPDTQAAKAAPPAAGTAVMAPLTVWQVGGLPGSTAMFKAYRGHMEKHGVSVVSAPAMSGGWDPSMSTTLTGGAAVAALASRGDLWVGAAGTITYATTDTVVAFGHPLFWEGRTGLELTNGWVDGIWASTLEPYKLIDPTAVRGVLTQDRGAGIAGRTDVMPEESRIAARALMVQDGRAATTMSWMPRWVVDSSSWNYMGLPTVAAYMAPLKATDAVAIPGTAITTSTVVVTDGTTTYTVTRPNVWDDPYDIAYMSLNDITDMVGRFQALNGLDMRKSHIVSVDFDTSISTTRQAARIVGLDVPGGLKRGANTVRTFLKVRGVVATQTVDTSLTIPARMALTGRVQVSAFDQGYSGMYYDPFGGVTIISGGGDFGSSVDPSEQQVKDVVSQLQGQQRNNQLRVVYSTGDGMGGGIDSGPYYIAASALPPTTIETSKALGWYLRGSESKSPARIRLIPDRRTLSYRGRARIFGSVYPVAGDTTLTVFGRSPGSSADTTLAQVAATTTSMDMGMASFIWRTPRLTRNTTITVAFPGDDVALPSSAAHLFKVAAKVTLSVRPSSVRAGRKVRLTAVVSASQGGRVAFETLTTRRGRLAFKRLARVSLKHGRAVFDWRPARGRHLVRARFLGGRLNGPASSRSAMVTVR